MLTWLRHRLGRRGASLLFFGMLDVFQAAALTVVPQDLGNTGVMTFPAGVWAAGWAGAAVLCFVSAFASAGRDAPGFAAAIGIKMLWGAGFIVEWVEGAHYLIALVGLTWWLFAAHVAICAGWPEPPAQPAPQPAPPLPLAPPERGEPL